MKHTTFADIAAQQGIKPQLMYSVSTVSRVLGVDQQTLYDEMRAGRLAYHLPKGRRQGRMIRAEWVDQWIEEGTHNVRA